MSDSIVQGGVPIESQQVEESVVPFGQPAVSTPQSQAPEESPISTLYGAPEEDNNPVAEPPKKPTDDNDAIRYQHFQSQADKLANQLNERDQQIQQLTVQNMQMMALMGNQMQAQQQVPQQENLPKPPVAPERPEEPAGYSREEALTDPTSESGKHLRELDSWRSKMDNYNDERLNFERQRIEDERAQLQGYVQQLQQQTQASQEEQQAMQLVQQKYGLNPQQAQQFVSMYARPESVSMDNLVNLYKLQTGLPLQPQQAQNIAPQPAQVQNVPVLPQQPQTPQVPSQQFQQVQHSQSLGVPMGIMPTAQENTQANYGDRFMDSLLENQSDPKKVFGEH